MDSMEPGISTYLCLWKSGEWQVMTLSRRDFIGRTVSIAVLAGVAPSGSLNGFSEEENDSSRLLGSAGDFNGERVANTPATWYRPYKSKMAHDPGDSTWVQIDLRSVRPIDEIKLLPWNYGFPVRFRIELSNDPHFASSTVIANRTKENYPSPGLRVVRFTTKGASGRYVRLMASRLRELGEQAG